MAPFALLVRTQHNRSSPGRNSKNTGRRAQDGQLLASNRNMPCAGTSIWKKNLLPLHSFCSLHSHRPQSGLVSDIHVHEGHSGTLSDPLIPYQSTNVGNIHKDSIRLYASLSKSRNKISQNITLVAHGADGTSMRQRKNRPSGLFFNLCFVLRPQQGWKKMGKFMGKTLTIINMITEEVHCLVPSQ